MRSAGSAAANSLLLSTLEKGQSASGNSRRLWALGWWAPDGVSDVESLPVPSSPPTSSSLIPQCGACKGTNRCAPQPEGSGGCR